MKLTHRAIRCLAWLDRCQRAHSRYQEYRERYEDALVYGEDALLVHDLVEDPHGTLEEIREESDNEGAEAEDTEDTD
ncbi:MAG: hypothetical protein ACXABY_20645 [Candidatus Thorarchaeota archaeon]|jgi:hypothetical protein